jgi:hypothetical protein
MPALSYFKWGSSHHTRNPKAQITHKVSICLDFTGGKIGGFVKHYRERGGQKIEGMKKSPIARAPDG